MLGPAVLVLAVMVIGSAVAGPVLRAVAVAAEVLAITAVSVAAMAVTASLAVAVVRLRRRMTRRAAYRIGPASVTYPVTQPCQAAIAPRAVVRALPVADDSGRPSAHLPIGTTGHVGTRRSRCPRGRP